MWSGTILGQSSWVLTVRCPIRRPSCRRRLCPAPSRAGHGRATSRQNAASKPNLDSRQHETSATPAGIQLSDLSKVELSSDQGLYPHLSDTIEPFKMLVKEAQENSRSLSLTMCRHFRSWYCLSPVYDCILPCMTLSWHHWSPPPSRYCKFQQFNGNKHLKL